MSHSTAFSTVTTTPTPAFATSPDPASVVTDPARSASLITASLAAEDLIDATAPTAFTDSARDQDRLPDHAPALLALLITLVAVGGGLALWTTLGDSTRLVIMVAVGLAAGAATLAAVRRARIHP